MRRAVVSMLSATAVALALLPASVAAVERRPASARCTIVGTSGPDKLVGTAKGDVICGRGGSDVLYGMDGDDILRGGPGRDRLLGGAGHDRLVGGPGRDQEHGGERGRPDHGKKHQEEANRERPVLSDLALSASAVDVTTGPARVTVRVRGRDVDDGLRKVLVGLPGPPPLVHGQGGWPRHEAPLRLVSGDRRDGWWQGEVEFGRHTPAGTHPLSVRGVDGRWGDASGLSLPVAVRNDDADLDAPEVTLLGPGPDHVVDVRQGSSSVTVAARITDARSGVHDVVFAVRERTPDGGGRGYLFMPRPVSGDRRDGVWQFDFPIPTVATSSRWTVSVTVRDWADVVRGDDGTTYWGPARESYRYGLVGEHRYLPGGAGAFGVRGNDSLDITAPAVAPVALTKEFLSPSTVALDYAAPVSDAGEVRDVVARLVPEGADPGDAAGSSLGVSSAVLSSGTPADGTWTGRFWVPRSALRGRYVLWLVATDGRGNQTIDDRTVLTEG